MQVFDSIKKTEYGCCVALGFFDGVHIGHRSVISATKPMSSDICPMAVLTFKDSPANVISNTKKPLLTTNKEKLKLFEKLGVQLVYNIDFNDIKDMSAEQFVKEVLHDKLNAKCVVTGFNYHFGKGGNADADDMIKLCNNYGIKAFKCEPVLYNGTPVSSTRIRNCIANGDVESANAMLGYDFGISSEVVSGNHIGNTIQTPTINQSLDQTVIIPKYGVYASYVLVDDKTYQGATNIGTHPTVGGNDVLCETHLLDFDGGDLYGKNVQTILKKFIREEVKFTDLESLKEQIKRDKEEITDYLNNKAR